MSHIFCIMETYASAPLLSRIKSWQLIGLGISGWFTLYSAALITWSAWGARSVAIGNAQGGCFAATMALASVEARRYRKTAPSPEDPLQWGSGISTEHLNLAIEQTMLQREFRVEPCHELETKLGFSVRAINAGRSIVFETARWKEPVIDMLHAQVTEENRTKVSAARAVIVGAVIPTKTPRLSSGPIRSVSSAARNSRTCSTPENQSRLSGKKYPFCQ